MKGSRILKKVSQLNSMLNKPTEEPDNEGWTRNAPKMRQKVQNEPKISSMQQYYCFLGYLIENGLVQSWTSRTGFVRDFRVWDSAHSECCNVKDTERPCDSFVSLKKVTAGVLHAKRNKGIFCT